MTEFRIGWQMYVFAMPIWCCGTGEMRRGWMAANKAEAIAMMATSLTMSSD